MKILLLCWRDSEHPQGGGSERYLERVGRYLAAAGHTVVYRTARASGAPRRSQRQGMSFLRRGGKYTVYPSVWLELAVGRMGWGPLRGVDAVVDTQNGIPFFARLWGGRPTVLLSHHCHREQWPVAGPVVARLGWFLESRVSPRLHRRCPYVTVSEPSKRELVEVGVHPERIRIIRNGVDPVPVSVPQLPPDGRRHLITLSRLVPHKHIERAIDAVSDLRRRGHGDVVLDVVGDGWWKDRLMAYAAQRDAPLTFHGRVSEELKHALLERAEVHLMPSAKEGWGLTVIEAAQHGVPTVAYRSAGGVQDSVAETGVLLDDGASLSDAVEKLFADPAERRALGEAARARAEAYSWDQTGAAFAELIDQVVAGERKRRQAAAAMRTAGTTAR